MINQYTMQFMTFNSIDKLNSWLRKYTDLIYIENWSVVDTGYVIQFRIKDGVHADDYEMVLNMVMSEAKPPHTFTPSKVNRKGGQL